MGILRADRIAGLGGANAIKGSVEFRADQNIQAEIVNGNADFNYGSGDFTIECWWNSGGDLSTDINFVTLWNYSSSRQAWGMYWDADDGNFGLIASTGGDIGSTDITYRQAAGFEKNRWYHLAIVRISNTLTLYKDGTSIGSNSSFTGTIYENTVDPLIIGGQMSGTSESNKIMRGFISNLRIIKGEGIYTGNFTPPTNELTVTPNTVLLACQSPGDILQEATGKTLVAYRSTTDSAFPVASRFTPNSPVGFSTTTDVGSQYGSTFDGFGSFATSTYMVPPGGNTRERNRGRGVSFGGDNNTTSILFVDIQSQGNGQDFGDLTQATNASPGACASSTRGVYAGGASSPTPNTDTIGFITIANTANALDFGNLSQARRQLGGCSNDTRGLFGSGRVTDPVNTIDFITIATTGNASDFGDVTTAARYLGSTSSTTRGFWFGGNAPTATNVINFVTIATTGDASDFGDLTEAKPYPTGCSSSTRAISFGGMVSAPNYINTIEYFTMASTGNGVDFGDCTEPNGNSSGMSNKTRGVRFAGAVVSGSYTNSIDFINIATTGNASDFGDFITAGGDGAGTSDSHGGLS